METLFFGAGNSVHMQNYTRTTAKQRTISIRGHFVELLLTDTTKYSSLGVTVVGSRRDDISLENSKAEFRKEVEERFIEHFGLLKWEQITRALTVSPAWTCIRLPYANRQDILRRLGEEVAKFNDTRTAQRSYCKLGPHQTIEDCVCLQFAQSVIDMDNLPPSRVIVDSKCGEAVLRGADVFAPGVKAATPGLMENDLVSVFIDVDNLVLYGEKDVSSTTAGRRLMFIGIGVAMQYRIPMFRVDRSGVAVRMTHRPTGDSPSLNSVLDGEIFLQNLPSALVSVVLDPKPGDLVLDMCASPGGKTSHLADRMRDQGIIVACDRSVAKCVPVKSCCDKFAAKRSVQSIVQVCQSNSATKRPVGLDGLDYCAMPFVERERAIVARLEQLPFDDKLQQIRILPPGTLPRGVFDKVLLDGPCSSLGLRPRFSHIGTTNKSLDEIASIQRRMLFNALHLVKLGGVILYSTCTFNPAENEGVIKWALDRFPMVIKLLPAEPKLGSDGMAAILGEENAKLVQRFDPSDTRVDSIGFFIAKLEKVGKMADDAEFE